MEFFAWVGIAVVGFYAVVFVVVGLGLLWLWLTHGE